MIEPAWLTETEQRAWRSWIDASRRIEAAVERQLKHDHELTLDDYEVLVRLSEADERRMRLTDLAVSVANSPSRLSQRIDRMADRGLVCREASADDGRVSLVCLTDRGFARLAAAAPDHVAEVRSQFVDRLSADDIRTLAEIVPNLLD